MTILVVDDSKAMRMIVMRTIRQAGFDGHEVVQAENGQAALDVVRGGLSCELILSDWNMPEMNGIDFLRALRAEQREVPFGFITSEGTPVMREQAKEAGADFLIAKPFTVDAFQTELARVL
jgi:two-component system chemotaxis response regulator CheY